MSNQDGKLTPPYLAPFPTLIALLSFVAVKSASRLGIDHARRSPYAVFTPLRSWLDKIYLGAAF
jgi:hypothetical protein